MKALWLYSLLLTVVSAQAGESGPVVAVSGGKLEGRLLSDGGAAFKGVPYAAAPVGNLRWHEPVAAKPWKGVRDAGSFGHACVQAVMDWNRQEGTDNQEDCLYLNIWTPAWPATNKLPVMLWIHGGGNSAGAASVDYFDGAALSRRGVVVVTINYRLGVFGFFAHPALTAESPHHAAGDYGLLDQLAALKWVQQNIASFGGDAANVTVFGQSAGSADTAFLLASPLSAGLFQRSIQESGTWAYGMPSLADAEQAGERFAASLNAPAGRQQLKFLRGLPAEQLRQAAAAAQSPSKPNMGPSVDGWFMPEPAVNLFAHHKEHAVPLLIGNNAQELGAPAAAMLRQAVTDAYGIDAGKALALYGLTGAGNGDLDPLYGPAAMQLASDSRQRCGGTQEAIWHSAGGESVYYYQFDHAIPGRPATQHSAELSYVFGNLLPGGFLGAQYGDQDRKISDTLQLYWSNFARSGDPNGAGLPQWPRYDAAVRPYLEFTDKGPVVAAGLRRPYCDLWMENLQQRINQ